VSEFSCSIDNMQRVLSSRTSSAAIRAPLSKFRSPSLGVQQQRFAHKVRLHILSPQ
jgi:hypothetical protein